MNTIAIVLAVIACASAAPRYHNHLHHHHHHYDDNDDMSLERFMQRDMFDTTRFWEEIRREMMGLNFMIANLHKQFGIFDSNEKVDGNQYKIRILLNGFDEKDIAVKAKKTLLIVQAVHKVAGEPEKNYLDLRTLPDFVDINGSWVYENGVLTIVFPINQKVEGEVVVTEAPVNQSPEQSREEVEDNSSGQKAVDADVGIERGDLGKETNTLSNEIPSGQRNAVEATTYAVDLKDEVQLVPIHRTQY